MQAVLQHERNVGLLLVLLSAARFIISGEVPRPFPAGNPLARPADQWRLENKPVLGGLGAYVTFRDIQG